MVLGSVAVAGWALVAWSTYGQVYNFSGIRTAAALAVVGVASVPALLIGLLLRRALVPTLYDYIGY